MTTVNVRDYLRDPFRSREIRKLPLFRRGDTVYAPHELVELDSERNVISRESPTPFRLLQLPSSRREANDLLRRIGAGHLCEPESLWDRLARSVGL